MDNNFTKEEKNSVFKFSLKFYIIMTAVTTFIGTLSQTVAFKLFFDEKVALYYSGSSIGRLQGIMLFVFALLLSSSALSTKKELGEKVVILEPTDNAVRVFSGMSAVFLSYKAYIYFRQIFFVNYAKGSYFFTSSMEKSETIITVIMLLLAIPTVVFLILVSFSKKEQDRIFKILGFFPIVWCAFCLLKTYFDTELPIKSPLKIFVQIIFVSFMLFFLSEHGLRVGKNKIRAYVVTASVSALLGITYSVSRILSRLLNKECIYSGYSLSLLILCISLYAFTRLISLSKKSNKPY